MNKKIIAICIVSVLVLAGCTMPAPAPETPVVPENTPITIPSNTPAEVQFTVVATEPAGVEETAPPVEPEQQLPTPTDDMSPPPTMDVQQDPTATMDLPTPTATVATNTPIFTPTPTQITFNPEEAFGTWQFEEKFLGDHNWTDSSGDLPDTDNIRLEIVDNVMRVMGKYAQFDTWWFTWSQLSDFYLQMQVQVTTCSGKDAYGFIFHGPPTGKPAHGYVVAFSCDGHYMIRRIDSANPWSATDLLIWEPSEYIAKGPDAVNTLGVHVVGNSIAVYANGEKLTEVYDDSYSSGRFGLWVNAWDTPAFTYRVWNIKYWDLSQ